MIVLKKAPTGNQYGHADSSKLLMDPNPLILSLCSGLRHKLLQEVLFDGKDSMWIQETRRPSGAGFEVFRACDCRA